MQPPGRAGGMLGDFARRLGDRRLLTAAGTVAVMVGLLGPFGTYLVSGPVARILFWVGVIGASLPVAVGCRVVVEHHLAGHGRWTRALAVCTGFTALYAPLLHGFIHARTGPEHMLWMNFGEIAASVFLIALTVNVIDHAVGLGAVRTPVARPAMAPERRALTPPPSAPAADAPPLPAPETPAPLPRLVARLPEALRAEVLLVSANDHYVTVRTLRGEAEILLRFGDAVAELDGIEGVRVHRSHWVARRAVVGTGRAGGRVMLQLCDGTRVPVSRRSRLALAALGLDGG